MTRSNHDFLWQRSIRTHIIWNLHSRGDVHMENILRRSLCSTNASNHVLISLSPIMGKRFSLRRLPNMGLPSWSINIGPVSQLFTVNNINIYLDTTDLGGLWINVDGSPCSCGGIASAIANYSIGALCWYVGTISNYEHEWPGVNSYRKTTLTHNMGGFRTVQYGVRRISTETQAT